MLASSNDLRVLSSTMDSCSTTVVLCTLCGLALCMLLSQLTTAI
jgi:hypothetical protein